MEEDEKNSTRISIAIPNEMYSWLEANKKINRSKLFRDAVNNIRHPAAIRISQARASSYPDPRAYPLMAAIMGF